MMETLRGRKRFFDLQSQRGAALVIAVLILLVLTVVGIYAVTSSTLETKIAGTERFLQEAFHAADGGVDYGRRLIIMFLSEQDPTLPSGASVDKDEFRNEILGANTGDPPTVSAGIGNCGMVIEVDRIKAEEPAGFSGEFGAPASEKKTTVYYLINSQSTGTIGGASSEIEATYRRLVQE